MRQLLLGALAFTATIVPAQAALFYLNDSEVLDSATGLVWLNVRLTDGMPFDNVYTQHGWRLAGPGGPFDLFTSNFPGVHDWPYSPYRPEVEQLLTFLGATTETYAGGGKNFDLIARNWDDPYNVYAITVLSYQGNSNYPDEWEMVFDDGQAFAANYQPDSGDYLFLVRDATPADFAVDPDRDVDGDGFVNAADNCKLIANPSQCDSDGDGYGNHCDGDLTQNRFTNAQDMTLVRNSLGSSIPSPIYNIADFNCNGFVNAQDITLFRRLLGSPPGPSGLAP
ncbi:MAG: hypothetical protein J0M16_08345 [Gammaproteobacteria bacterium]|nr:hypothetical protein [Gammaproteobacteria bacterium]